jgi:riboflavin transporter FmnP
LNTKKLAITIVFAALTIALNPALSRLYFAAPFAPVLIYQVWEIPIVIALLIISPIAGITISLINTGALLILFPGVLPAGPLYNLLATLSMQIGICLIIAIIKKTRHHKNYKTNIINSPKWVTTTAVGISARVVVFMQKVMTYLFVPIVVTAFGIFTRVVFMSVILYFALPQQPPIGFGFDQIAINAYLPIAAIFNATLALYTIPIGWIIAKRVQKILHITLQK